MIILNCLPYQIFAFYGCYLAPDVILHNQEIRVEVIDRWHFEHNTADTLSTHPYQNCQTYRSERAVSYFTHNWATKRKFDRGTKAKVDDVGEPRVPDLLAHHQAVFR
jgi:hypothetical protein